MGRRLVGVVVFLLLVAAAPARAHDTGESHPHGADVTHRDTIQELNFDFVAAVEGNAPLLASGYGDDTRTYLPKRWCGTRRTTDNTANQVYDPALPQLKFIYAYASDQVDRTTEWADLLQANASLISRFYAQQSDGQRAPRIDLGTNCGAAYIDLATVALPGPRSTYVDNFDALDAAVSDALPRTDGQTRNYVILGDKLSAQPAGYLWGQGQLWGSDAKGTSNIHNDGGLASIIWIPQAQTLPSTEAAKDQGFWPEGFLHEITHNFGGVQDGSPNSTLAGHCWDGKDVMCYADGGSVAYNSTVCSGITSFTTQFAQVLDCGRNDYFSPAPTAGSWLDTHFNTFDVVFNGDCPTLGSQCGSSPATPAVSGGPTVSGTTRQGQSLTGTLGTWTNSTSTTYQWEEEVSGTWQNYANASLTLNLGTANIGRRYRLKVTAAGTETVVARSAPTAAVTAPLSPQLTAYPTVSGSPNNGATVTGTNGSWNNASSYAYLWQRWNGSAWVDISGATASSYVLTPSDVNYYVRIKVTATSPDGVSAWTTSSNYIGPIVSGPINSSLPTVSGTAKIDQTLTSTNGTWSQTPTSYARQWQREVGGTWTPISGATATTYTATAADVGYRLRVGVTATNATGATTAYSAPTLAVAPLAPPVNTAIPVVTGTLQQGQTLTAGSDTWTGMTSTTVAWQRRVAAGGWTAIAGAAARTYVLTSTDVDAEIRAVVTATNADGSTVAYSDARGPVVTNVPPANTVLPAVSGTARTGQVLTATTGTWLRATSYAYAWQRLSSGIWSNISGATAATYTPVPADAGMALRVVVTATGPGGSTAANSAQTAAVSDPPILLSGPAVSGTAKRTRTLTATTGTWTNATSHAYSWERETSGVWAAISGATGSTYVPVAGDVGHALRVRVIASNPTDSAEATSGATAAVVDLAPPVLVTPPAVQGTLYEGETVTAANDDWTGETSTSVQWQRKLNDGAWSDIDGATDRSHTLGAADRDADLRVRVTATNDDGQTSQVSAARGPVDADPVNTAVPTIAGIPGVGTELTATPGTWLRTSRHEYAWERRSGDVWIAIAGASDPAYTPVAADAGLQLRVVVTGFGSRADATAASLPTAPVGAAPVLETAPAVTGTAKRGRTLTATSGTWANATTFAYRWERMTDGVWAPIPDATTTTHMLAAGDVGKRLRVVVTAGNANGETEAGSDPTAVVADLQPPANTAVPVVTGTTQVGQTLTGSGDAWTGADTLRAQWQRRPAGGTWTDIAGETSRTHVLVAADQGADLRIVVTAANADGETAATSAARGPVSAAPTTTTVVPPAETAAPATSESTGTAPAATDPVPADALPATTTAADRAEVLLRRGGKSVGKLVFTLTRSGATTSATISAAKLKLASGAYTVKVCAGRKCVTRKAKIAKGKLRVAKFALPASTGRLKLTVKPRKGKALSGALVF